MKTLIPALLILFTAASAQPVVKSNTQQLSLAFTNLSEKQVANLELLGRVWGFLKYHHPKVGNGKYTWDNELLTRLPLYINLTDDDARDKFLMEWIESLGEVKVCKSCRLTQRDAFLKPDLKWIEAGSFSKQLKETLMFIYHNRHQGNHQYIKFAPNVGNPEFLNEDPYASMPYPDEAHRLLTLFRYWNMIYYFFPYKHLMDKDWNLKLHEYIPVLLQASNELEYELATIQLIGDIQDTHANLWTGADKIFYSRGQYSSPVHTRFVENKLVITDFYKSEMRAKLPLKIGDVITTINGHTVEQLVQERSKYYPASNEPARLRGLSQDMLRSTEPTITVGYVRGDAPEQVMDLGLYPWDSLGIDEWYKQKPKPCYWMLDNNIGYITLGSIAMEDVPKIKEAFINTQGIVIDIRNYPSAGVLFALGSYFVSSPTSFVKFTRAVEGNPGEFIMRDYTKIFPDKKLLYKGKLMVLVNELTQSAAEYAALSLRAGANTTVIGSTTAGADGNVSAILLPGGLKTWISGIGVYYPDGRETQRVGIVPDVEVKPTIEGIRMGRDELLEKAITLILEK